MKNNRSVAVQTDETARKVKKVKCYSLLFVPQLMIKLFSMRDSTNLITSAHLLNLLYILILKILQPQECGSRQSPKFWRE